MHVLYALGAEYCARFYRRFKRTLNLVHSHRHHVRITHCTGPDHLTHRISHNFQLPYSLHAVTALTPSSCPLPTHQESGFNPSSREMVSDRPDTPDAEAATASVERDCGVATAAIDSPGRGGPEGVN